MYELVSVGSLMIEFTVYANLNRELGFLVWAFVQELA